MHPRMRTVRLLGRALGAAALALALAGLRRPPRASEQRRHAARPPAPRTARAGADLPHSAGRRELHVRFTYQPEMNEQVPVRPDGRISLVSTGEIDAVGHTPPELERVIVERSSAHLRNPEVTVIVTKLGEQRVYVGGEVLTPGYIPLRAGMTPLQAVLERGGFKATAKRDSVLLLTPGADGHFSAARIDLEQVLDAGVPERVRLHPNDVLYVPRTWIAGMDIVVDQYIRGLIPTLPRVGAGVQVN